MPVSIRTIVNSINSVGFTGSIGPQGFTGSASTAVGPTGPQGFTGSYGPTGPQGFTGSLGFTGSQGQSAGLRYDFSTNTATNADPGQGIFRFNSATPGSVTQISMDILNVGGVDVTAIIDSWDNSTDPVKGYLEIDSNLFADTTYYQFQLNTITTQTGYRQLNVTFISGSATLPAAAEQCVIRFYRTGSLGYTGSTGPTGPQGFTGSLGFTGSIGAGFTGSASTAVGPQGFTGSVGGGFTGSASTAVGPQGFTGSVGAGFTGSIGSLGFTGSIGTSAGFPYQYSNTTTASDPGTGFFRFNSLTTGSITEMYISNLDASGGTDRSSALLTLDDTAGTNRATIYIPGPATGFTVSITVTGAITNNGTWLTIPVTFNTGALPSNNELRNVIGVRNGDFGFTGSVGAGFTGSIGDVGFTGSAGTSPVVLSGFQPHKSSIPVAAQIGQGTIFLDPVEIPVEINIDRIAYPMVFTTGAANNGTLNMTIDVGIYTKNASTLSALHSTRFATTYTVSTSGYTSYGGVRNFTIPWTTTITGGEYVFAFRSSTNAQSTNLTISNFVASNLASILSGNAFEASNISAQRTLGLGIFSVASASLPASMSIADIRGGSNTFQRPPIFFLTSGTA